MFLNKEIRLGMPYSEMELYTVKILKFFRETGDDFLHKLKHI